MKGSLKLRPRRVLTKGEAWACFSANLALAGSGSLAAGRMVGYAQLVATTLAMILTFVSGIPMIKWAMANDPGGSANEDPFQGLQDLWVHARWPIASIALYAGTVVWATMTSFSIINESKRQQVPPKIG